MNNTIGANYKAAWQIVKDKKWKLCGFILLELVFSILAVLFGILPIVSIPLCFAISVSSAAICLKGVRGENVDSKNLFDGFKNLKHSIGGMAWMSLWVCIWMIVPIIFALKIIASAIIDVFNSVISFDAYYPSAGTIVMFAIACILILVGCVIMIIKAFTYCFTPYILTDKPEIHAMDAIKESKKLTVGIRGKIFWANVIPTLILLVVDIVLCVFASIPYIGVLFEVIMSVLNIAADLFMAIFLSLTLASFYNKASVSEASAVVPAAAVVENPAPAPVSEAATAPVAPAPAVSPENVEQPKAE